MPLTTRCRHCGRLFPVYAQQIKERGGKVACPQCGKRFDALGGLLDEAIPGGEIEQYRRGTGKSVRPTIPGALRRRRRREHMGSSLQPAAAAPAEMLDLGEGRERRGRASAVLWSLGIMLLIVGLVLQIGWWDRGRWMQQPQVRAGAEAICTRIGCRLGLPRLAGTMEILQPALTLRDKTSGSLRLTLILVNKADVSQSLPQLQLELYDEKNELTAARRFGPNEYLPDADPGRPLASGAAVRPLLDLAPLPVPMVGFRVKLF